MQHTLLANPDRRPLPPGWTTHLNPERRLWFYINLDAIPPLVTFIHPADDDDEDEPSPPDQLPPKFSDGLSEMEPPLPLPPVVQPMPAPQRDSRRMSNYGGSNLYTPFKAAAEAQRTKEPSFAQQLYAGALPKKYKGSHIVHAEDHFVAETCPVYSVDMTGSPPESAYTPSEFSTPPPLSDSLSDSSYFPSPSPQFAPFRPSEFGPYGQTGPVPANNIPPLPRGARSPAYPRPLPSPGPRLPPPSLSSRSVIEDDFSPSSLYSSALLNSMLSRSTRNSYTDATTTRYRRTSTFSDGRQATYGASPPKVISSLGETPNYCMIARPLDSPPDSAQITTPAFQYQSPPLSTLQPVSTSTAASVAPSSSSYLPDITSGNPSFYNTHPIVHPTIQREIPSQLQVASQPAVSDAVYDNAQHSAHRKRNKLIKTIGVAVGKSALRTGAKMALGSVGLPTSIVPSSDDGGILGAISTGMSDMAASAVSEAISHAVSAVENSGSDNTALQQVNNAIPPLQLDPAMIAQPPINSIDYASILNQMQSMQLTQSPQQFLPQPIIDPSDYMAILKQIHPMQLENNQQRQLPMFSHQTLQQTAPHPMASQYRVQLTPTGIILPSQGAQSPRNP